jgi:hypothetical protein
MAETSILDAATVYKNSILTRDEVQASLFDDADIT